MPTIDWNVKNAINRDVERQHLNKILADIRASVQSLESKTGSASLTPSSLSTIKDAVGQMVVNNSENGISVTYNNLAKVLDFAVANFMLTLAGDVTGSVTLSPGSNAVMQVAIDPALIGIGEAPMDNQPYWRQSGGWEMVPPNISTLTEIATSGIMVLNTADPEEPVWTPRTIQNGAGIDWTNPDGVAGDPQAIFNADTAEVASLPGATYKTVQKTIDVMFSPGIITGGEVTELTTTSVRITAGTAVVRIADDNVSELRFFDFPSQDFSVPDVQVTHFYALDYNGGSPVIVETTVTESWDRDTQIPLGSALRGDGLLNITANPYRVGDVITNLIQRLDAIGPVQRDNSVGGLALGETGTRNATVSAGRLWSRVSDFTIPSKNSSVDTMASVYFNGVNLTVTSGLTQWDNLNFNNLGTGSLQVMGNNKYANLWFFMSFNGDHYGFAYGTNEYNTLGDAANEGVPAYLTQNFFNQFILLGRLIFQKSAATASIIESAFVTPFSAAAINTHNNLGGLQGGTAGEFYHLTLADYTKVTALPASSQPLDADLTAIAALASTGFATRTAANTWAQRSFPNGTGFTWTNPAGVAGDPTLVLSTNLQAWSGVTTASKADDANVLHTSGNETATGTKTFSTGVVVGAVSNTIPFTPSLRVEFDDTVALASGVFIRYGSTTASAFVGGFKARGTAGAPTQTMSGDSLMGLRGGGWHSGGAFGGSQAGEISIRATEDFTSTAQGTRIAFRTTSNGTTSATDRWTVDQNGDCFVTGGRLYGTALHNNAAALTGTTNQYIGSGTYTPVLTNTANVAATTSAVCQWDRVGNVVTVSGRILVTTTAAAATLTQLRISLPIASALTTTAQVGGTGARRNAAAVDPGQIEADVANDEALLSFFSSATASAATSFQFTYVVV